MKTVYALLLFILSLTSGFSQNMADTIYIKPLDYGYISFYPDSIQFVDSSDIVYNLPTADPNIFQQFIIRTPSISIKNKNGWTTLSATMQSIIYDNRDFLQVDSVALIQINGVGREELLIHYAGVMNGSRGGTTFEYVQIWDIDKQAIVIEFTTFEQFEWFGKGEGEWTCSRAYNVRPGIIEVNALQCDYWEEADYTNKDSEQKDYLFRVTEDTLINTLAR